LRFTKPQYQMSDKTQCPMTIRLKSDFTFIPEIDIHTPDLSKIPKYIKRLNQVKNDNLQDLPTPIYQIRQSNADIEQLESLEELAISEIEFLNTVIDFLQKRLDSK